MRHHQGCCAGLPFSRGGWMRQVCDDRTTRRRVAFVIALVATLGIGRAGAELLVYEGFDYAAGATLDGRLHGGFGWGESWPRPRGNLGNQASESVRVRSGGLVYGGLVVQGNAFESAAMNSGTVPRRFSSAIGGSAAGESAVWISLIMGDDDRSAESAVDFYHSNTGEQAVAFDDSNAVFRIRIGQTDSSGVRVLEMQDRAACRCSGRSGSGLPLSQGDNLVIVRIEIGTTTRVSAWFNPTEPQRPGAADQLMLADWPVQLRGIGWSVMPERSPEQWNARLDEIRIGTTLADVVPTEDYRNGWTYAERIYLNTLPSGAGVNGDVYGFPVLVRLSGDILDFSELAYPDDGRDIRFAKNDGTPLFYEIERWENGVGNADTAEVWVRIDTVRGADQQQSFTMHWGNSSVTDHSTPAKVFDTRGGFTGVWHFAASDTFTDATCNANNAANHSTVHGQDGVVSLARDCHGSIGASYVGVPDASSLDITRAVTLSGWVNIRSLSHAGNSSGSCFFGKLRDNGSQLLYGLSQSSSHALMLSIGDASGARKTLRAGDNTLVAGEWLYLAGAYDAAGTSADATVFLGRSPDGFSLAAHADSGWGTVALSDGPPSHRSSR